MKIIQLALDKFNELNNTTFSLDDIDDCYFCTNSDLNLKLNILTDNYDKYSSLHYSTTGIYSNDFYDIDLNENLNCMLKKLFEFEIPFVFDIYVKNYGWYSEKIKTNIYLCSINNVVEIDSIEWGDAIAKTHWDIIYDKNSKFNEKYNLFKLLNLT